MQEGMTCDHCGPGAGCKCPHHKMMPVFIVLIGLVFLLEALGALSATTAGMLWPILLILIGLQKMFSGMCKCCGMCMDTKK